jgi:hypothetical protein
MTESCYKYLLIIRDKVEVGLNYKNLWKQSWDKVRNI